MFNSIKGMNKKKSSDRFILGTAQLGSNYGFKKKVKTRIISNQIINEARKKNITLLDMADSYTNSIKILKKQNLKNWKICFKISHKSLLKNYRNNNFLNYFFKSLKELNINNYEYFLFHNVNSLNTKFGKRIYNILNILKKNGFIKKIGISLYAPKEIEHIIEKFQIDVVQIPLNVFDQRFLKKRLLSKLKKRNIEIHVRSIFLQGLLTLKYKDLPKKFKRFKNIFNKWENFLKTNNSNAIKESLQFIYNINEIDKIVIGFDNPKQLLELFSYVSKRNSHDYSKLKSNNLSLIDPRKW